MSHELDRKADGTGAMFSVGETPWHQSDTNSTILTVAPRTAREAAKFAGLDWEVELRPAHVGIGNGDYIEIPGAFGVVRTDREQPLAVVGKIYRPLQNYKMLETLQPLVDQGLASWETAGSLQGGRRVWGLVRLNLDSPTIRAGYESADRVIPFEMISNVHDGSAKVVLAETTVRVVCRNTEIMAMHDIARRASTQRVTHNAQVESNVAQAAAELWADLIKRHEGLAKQIVLLRQTRLDDQMFRELVLDVAVPMPVQGKDNDLSKALMRTRLEKAEAKRATLSRLWTEGLGQSGDRSAWEALNAVTEATDHDRGVFTPKGSRLDALMPGGLLQEIKQSVRAQLLAFADRKENQSIAVAV